MALLQMKETKPVLSKARYQTTKITEKDINVQHILKRMTEKHYLIDELTLNKQPGVNTLEITDINDFLSALLNPFNLDNNTKYTSLHKLASSITAKSATVNVESEVKILESNQINNTSGTPIDVKRDIVYCLEYDRAMKMLIVAKHSADIKIDLNAEIMNENCPYGITYGVKSVDIDVNDTISEHQMQFSVYRGCNDALIREISKYINSIYLAMKELKFKADNIGNNISCPPLRSFSYILLQLLTDTTLADELTYISTNLALIGMERYITVGVLLTLVATSSRVPKPEDWKKPALQDDHIVLTALTQVELKLPFIRVLIFRRVEKQFVNNNNAGMATFDLAGFTE